MARAFTPALKGAIPVVCLLAAALVVVAHAADQPPLTGRWNFNPTVSDDATQKVHAAQQISHHPSDDVAHSYPGAPGPHPGGYPGVGVDTPVPGGGVRVGDPDGTTRGEQGAPIGGAGGGVNYPGGNGGDPGSRGGPGGGQSKRSSGGANAAWHWLTRDPQYLQIERHARQIVITDDSGQSQTYYPDGKKHEEKDAQGNKTSTKAEWEGHSLRTETRLARAEILTVTFRPNEDGSQIYVKTRFESPSLGGPVDIRRVYDLAKAPAK